MMTFRLLISCLILLSVVSCRKTMPVIAQENTILDGPIEGLTYEEQLKFLRGDEAFGEVFTSQNGLGPLFVANQCASCHAGDGKGTPFVEFKRFGQVDSTGNQFLHLGGPQLQNKALPGFTPETLPIGATFTTLIAPAVTGLGYLDAIPDADLIAISDPNDTDGDGISGRPHWNNIPAYVTLRPETVSWNGRYISRFGKKGNAYDLLQQTAEAYNQDMGITSIYQLIDTYSGEEIDPELSTNTLNDVVFYLKTLKAPIQRNESDADVQAGRLLFDDIDCRKCHTPSWTTGYSKIEVLSFKEFYPYTDLLLHDMGAQLDDNYTEGFATTSEWKTPALWGLGLSKDAQGGSYFLMHDGRAHSIEEAILLHGGEASNSKEKYKLLTPSEKSNLLKFLESL